MWIYITLLLYAVTIYAYPIANDIKASSTEGFHVQIDRFAQLIAIHWQFDHLDTIISKSYKEIANQFQEHVQITIQSNDVSHVSQQVPLSPSSSSVPLDIVDLDILKAQMFGAIQAHTEGKLPLAWDKVGDLLGRPALEVYIREVLQRYCRQDVEHAEEGHKNQELQQVSSSCLAENAQQLSAELDHYVGLNLVNIFETLDKDVLPGMLMHISRDLKDVLEYFNKAFLHRDDRRLFLNVIPWQASENNGDNNSLSSRLLELATGTTREDDHPTDFFSHYASLARV
ncbi:hypothetical protein EC973_001640 [Apophysomyces ossiformis]|uniref:Uncharacterized protein n=1 Tax=Apophysomyces ossiformis TaxID=679940 RepID=A0A8H7ETB4_9FUNG|nr:hypothetical protein EC973_001640 [Apophysomyces ossiformis]